MKRMLLNRPSSLRYLPYFYKIKQYSMVRFPSHVQVLELLEELDREGVQGKVVECGCWKGGLVSFVSHFTKREVVGIDTFEGLNAAGVFDGKVATKHKKVEGHLAVTGERAPLSPNGSYVQGDAASSLPDRIALLRVDVDLYDDTKRLLVAAKNKLVPGAWIVLDDYDDFRGARQAVHEFLYEEKRFPKIRQHPYGGSFYFKWR